MTIEQLLLYEFVVLPVLPAVRAVLLVLLRLRHILLGISNAR